VLDQTGLMSSQSLEGSRLPKSKRAKRLKKGVMQALGVSDE